MELLATLFQLVLALFGLDLGGATFSHRSTVDGVDTLYSIARVESGIARFECLASASGRCYYTVFPASCAGVPSLAGTRIGRCDAMPPRRFALPAGGRREIPGMAVEVLCVRGDGSRVTPDCQGAGAAPDAVG